MSSIEEKLIDVGIPTDGSPQLDKQGEHTLLRNMVIGLGFHWQRTVEALLPGEILIADDNVYRIIDRLPVETYLECVVGSEMNPAAPEEFLKAHAVISRSWAYGKIDGIHSESVDGKIHTPRRIIDWQDTCDHIGFDVCSDDHCQRYQGMQPMNEKLKRAVRATSGICLYDSDGTILDARFSKCCGGHTEIFPTCWQDTDIPSLSGFEDPWCDLSALDNDKKELLLRSILKDYDQETGDGYRWSTKIGGQEIRCNLESKFGMDIGKILDLKILERGVSGRAKVIKIVGERDSVEIGKELMIRRLLAPTHLYSSWIDIEKDTDNPDTYLINGRGWGHGVGLCQIGAARMATEGYSYEDILAFYYPGSHLGKHGVRKA